MNQIIVVTNHREIYEQKLGKCDLHITWCEFSIEGLQQIRGRAKIILLCPDHEKTTLLNKLGLYLRDLCIEEEKDLYLYGNKDDVDDITELVPSIFVKKAIYSFVDFSKMKDAITSNVGEDEIGKKTFLIIDDDTDYAGKLRVHLDQTYRVLVSRFDLEEMGSLILGANVVLISMDGSLKLNEFMTMFRILAAKKGRNPRFKYYYLTGTDRERAKLNSGSEKSSISFSKEMDVSRVANYFIGLQDEL
jgi:hypothetical protein